MRILLRAKGTNTKKLEKFFIKIPVELMDRIERVKPYIDAAGLEFNWDENVANFLSTTVRKLEKELAANKNRVTDKMITPNTTN